MTALELAREHRPDVPFIFVSGTLGDDLAAGTLRQGAADYLLKDRLACLVPAVRRAVDQARAKARPPARPATKPGRKRSTGRARRKRGD
jgi:DNA-binding NtrC family response regulator